MKRWNAFWWDDADTRVLAMLRIGWALVCLRALLPLWPELEFLFTDAGMLPLESRASFYGSTKWTLFSFASSIDEVQLLFGGILGLFVMTGLGLGTRVVMPLAWIGLVSLYNRNGSFAAGSDVVLRVLGFYLLFLPTSRMWSLDKLIAGKLGWGMPTQAPPKLMLRLFQLNVCLIYCSTALVKGLEAPWIEGTAVYRSLATEHYWRFDLTPILAHPWTMPISMAVTWVTLAWEGLFPLVFWKKVTHWVLLMGVALHLGIVACLNIGPFSEVMMWSYLAFLTLRKRT